MKQNFWFTRTLKIDITCHESYFYHQKDLNLLNSLVFILNSTAWMCPCQVRYVADEITDSVTIGKVSAFSESEAY